VARCAYCGQYFMSDVRVGIRQKACCRPACKKLRKKDAQKRWCAKNPGYFQGRYPYVKTWRQKRRMIQDEIPPRKPYVELILRIPGRKKQMIQDEIRLRRVGSRTFAAYGYS
jgi:hypothetical protein